MKNRKTFSHKRTFIAAALAAMMLTLTCGTAYADSNVDTSVAVSETAELTDIGGYACYERDGNYWTMIDGEEYFVVDTREALEAVSSAETVSNAQTAAVTPLADTVTPPPGWNNSTFMWIYNEQTYTDKVDLSRGDYCSDILNMTPIMKDFKFTIKTNHIRNHNYDFQFYYHHSSPINKWDCESANITFNGIINFKVLIPGTASGIIDYVGIKVLSSSEGRRDFQYWFTPKVITT